MICALTVDRSLEPVPSSCTLLELTALGAGLWRERDSVHLQLGSENLGDRINMGGTASPASSPICSVAIGIRSIPTIRGSNIESAQVSVGCLSDQEPSAGRTNRVMVHE